MIDMEFWIFGCVNFLAVRGRRPIYGGGESEARRLCGRLVPIDPRCRPGVEEVRLRNDLSLGRLQGRVRKSRGPRCGGRTGKVPIR